MIIKFIQFCRDHMKMVKMFCWSILLSLMAVDLFIPRHHPHFLGDEIPGFWAIFGFTACALIIILSKWLGHKFLFRPDDYYDSMEKEK